jgi:hypothetical protein
MLFAKEEKIFRLAPTVFAAWRNRRCLSTLFCSHPLFFFFLSQLHGTFKEKGEEHRQLNLSKN